MRSLKASDMSFGCTRESACLMAEQFALQQALGNGGAVHLDVLTFPAIGKKVQAGGNQLLAGATFADDEHGFAQRGDQRDVLQYFQEGGGFAEQAFWVAVHLAIMPKVGRISYLVVGAQKVRSRTKISQ